MMMIHDIDGLLSLEKRTTLNKFYCQKVLSELY